MTDYSSQEMQSQSQGQSESASVRRASRPFIGQLRRVLLMSSVADEPSTGASSTREPSAGAHVSPVGRLGSPAGHHRSRRDDTTEGGAPKKPRKGGGLRFLRDIVVIFIAALLISFLIKTFLVRSFFIPSASMEDTLQIHDRIIVNELVPKVVGIKRGDVVVFKDPGGWLGPEDQASTTTGNPVVDGVQWFLTQVGLGTQDSDDHLIKRVIGLPGDKVACCNAFGQMTVNGVPLEEPYTKLPAGVTRESENDFSVTVPEGSLWVEGDNRYNSADSRLQTNTPSKGFVPISDVVGRAFVITWPSAHWGTLSDYPNVFRGVGDATK